jgi:putative protease
LEDTPDRIWWWLPPVIWPTEETAFRTLVDTLTRNGGRHFVLNAPWQSVFFRNPKKFDLWAGPFCNITNPMAVDIAAALGFSGVILSPEMKREDYLLLPRESVLPLGIVVSGNWPLCIARTASEYLKTDIPFSSPKGEIAWVRKQDSNFWIYPNWILDLNLRKEELKLAGYSLFVHLVESLPKRINVKKRPGLWNWETGLL